MAAANVTDKTLLTCKKCWGENDKPVGSKCDRQKVTKHEKHDTSKETGTKKTPRGKVSSEPSSHEKMMEVMITTMTSFSEKLEAMEERIMGLTSRAETPSDIKQGTRKSRSKEKIHRIEISDDEEKTSLFSPKSNVVHGQDGTAFAHVFPDTAVAAKPVCTPARPKKHRGEFDLGVTPLFAEPAKTQPKVVKNILPKVTATVSKPPENLHGKQFLFLTFQIRLARIRLNFVI